MYQVDPKPKVIHRSKNQCGRCGALYCTFHDPGWASKAIQSIVEPKGPRHWAGHDRLRILRNWQYLFLDRHVDQCGKVGYDSPQTIQLAASRDSIPTAHSVATSIRLRHAHAPRRGSERDWLHAQPRRERLHLPHAQYVHAASRLIP